jgi:CarD family transcriptional regulator
MYKVGDKAVYPSHGLVSITGIQKQEIAGATHEFLILKVVDSDITVMIPTNSVQAKELRPLAKRNELKTLWLLIKGKTKYKIEENLSWNKRYRSYTEKLKTGNIIMAGEQKILENAFKRLVKEVSASLKSKEELVHADIKKLLSKEELINI